MAAIRYVSPKPAGRLATSSARSGTTDPAETPDSRPTALRQGSGRSAAAHLRSRVLDDRSLRSGLSGAMLYEARMVTQMPLWPPATELSEADAPEVLGLYGRCADYFLLQDGMAPTLADAEELFTDVPPEKDASDQTVLGWRGGDGLDAIAAILRGYPHDGTWYLGFMIVDAAGLGLR